MMKVPLLGHQREVAHEHRLALDLAGGVVHELGRDEQRGGVRHVPLLALLDRSTWAARSGGRGTTATSIPEKSSIGVISSKISSRPDCVGDVVAALAWPPRPGSASARCRAASRSCSVWRARRSGTSRGSWILREGDTAGDRCSAVFDVLGRCARRPRGVLPQALCGLRAGAPDGQDHETAGRTPGRTEGMAARQAHRRAWGKVAGQRKAIAYPRATRPSSPVKPADPVATARLPERAT